MTNSEQLASDQKLGPPMEDWCGSGTDEANWITIRRAYNGAIVHAFAGQDRHVLDRETLVFQSTEALVDWIQHWHKTTSMGAKP